MAFLDDKAEVIVAVDIEGIGKGCVGQLGIRRQIFACDCVIQFDCPAWLGKEQAKGGVFVIAARHFADARLCAVFFLRCGICVLIFLRYIFAFFVCIGHAISSCCDFEYYFFHKFYIFTISQEELHFKYEIILSYSSCFPPNNKSMGSDDLLGRMLLTGARWWWAGGGNGSCCCAWACSRGMLLAVSKEQKHRVVMIYLAGCC